MVDDFNTSEYFLHWIGRASTVAHFAARTLQVSSVNSVLLLVEIGDEWMSKSECNHENETSELKLGIIDPSQMHFSTAMRPTLSPTQHHSPPWAAYPSMSAYLASSFLQSLQY